MEVDVSKKAAYFVKYGLAGLILLTLVCSAGVWFYQRHNHYMKVYDARVTSTMVGVKTKADGKIAEIRVSDGEYVEAGTVVAKIAVSVTEEQIQQLQQNLELAKHNLAEIQKGQTITTPIVNGNSNNLTVQADLSRAEARMKRMNELFEMGAISAVKWDEAAADYAAAQAAASAASVPNVTYQTTVQPSSPEVIKSAEIQVRQAEAALTNAKQDSQATEILAPVAGTIYFTDFKEGSDVRAGQTVMNIGDAGNIWLEARVTPDQKQRIRLGQFAEYDIEGHVLQGTVLDMEADAETDSAGREVSSAANTEGSAPTMDDGKSFVKISLPTGVSFDLKPGMKAVVQFAVDG